MKPVRVRIDGLIPMTRWGYKVLLLFTGLGFAVLLAIRLLYPQLLTPRDPQKVPQPDLVGMVWQYTPLIIFILALLTVLDAVIHFRRFDQAEAEVARGVLDAVEVARQPPLRRQHHDAGGVRELLRLLVEGVLEADGLRQRAAPSGLIAPAALPSPVVICARSTL